MQTPRATPRWRDPVERDQYSAPPGRGQGDTREVLVGPLDITGFRDKFRTHSASLHDPFTSFVKARQRSRN